MYEHALSTCILQEMFTLSLLTLPEETFVVFAKARTHTFASN